MARIGRRPRYLATLLVTGSVALTACGGGDGEPPFVTATPAITATVAATETVAGATSVAPATTTPAQTTYTVVAGDTLNAIAAQFGTTVEAIVEANDLADPDVIDIGQVLVIPD